MLQIPIEIKPIEPKRRSRILALATGVVILTGGLWLWVQADSRSEGASPDHIELGTVYVGSKVEFHAILLTTVGGGQFDAIYGRLMRAMPHAWQPKLMQWHPRVRRAKSFVPVDLATLKPAVDAPSFIKVVSMGCGQGVQSTHGLPYVGVRLELDTSRAGDYSGNVTATMNGRQASLPVRVLVREKPEGISRLLIATTPYRSSSTEYGSDFHALARVISASGLAADYLNELPAQLENYRTIVLTDEALSQIATKDVGRVRAFVAQGGRLILPCNYFFRGTVDSANLILADHGLQVADVDGAKGVVITNLVSDPLTHGVARLEFDRPSPIQVTDPAQGKLLALGPTSAWNGCVAVSRPPGGGEIVVIASSLWWLWLGQFNNDADNERLMRNLLMAPGTK